MPTEPMSSRGQPNVPTRLFLGLFFGVFLVIGLGLFLGVFGRAVVRSIGTRGWSAVPCEILASRVIASTDSDGNTYRVGVTYRYHIADRAYIGNRYQFLGGSSSGYAGKAKAVARLPQGTVATCYVDPANPGEAVMVRGLTAEMFFAFIPLIFVVIGAGGVYAAVSARGGRKLGFVARNSVPVVTFADATRGAGPTLLQPKMSRRTALLGWTFFAGFWNFVVLMIFRQLVDGIRRGHNNWALAAFLIPFVLVGAGLVVMVMRRMMILANPRPWITVGSAVISLGDELRMNWAIDGRTSSLRRLQIHLEGREEATYRRGTDTKTDTHVFATMRLADESGPVNVQGSVRLTLPAETIHSFEAPNNKIVWVIRVRGEIPNWPDSDDEFPLTVAPRRR